MGWRPTDSACPKADFDSTDAQLHTNADEIHESVRSAGPIVWSALHGGHWVVADHELCRAVARDPSFSSASGVHVPNTPLYERGIRIFALEHDGAEHREQRAVLQGAVPDRPSKVDADLIRGYARRLLDALVEEPGPVDLMAGLANPLPLDVIFAVMGADEEFKPEMKALVDSMIYRVPVPGVDDPAARIHEIAAAIVERRVDDPRDDWVTSLTTLPEKDSVDAVVSLITGGHHSTSRGIASLLARLLTEPGLRDRLARDPDQISLAAEETLRLHTPLPSFSRRATAARAVGNADVDVHEQVLMLYAAANRDPHVYDEPETFRLDRSGPDHLAFGFGPHRCVGVHLARAEMRIAVEELLRVAPEVELVESIDWRGPAEPFALVVLMR